MISAARRCFSIAFVTVFLCLICATLCARTHSGIFSLLRDSSYTELPFRMEQDLVIIPVTLNGAETMNFILDTGTDSPVILNRRYIKNLELPLGKYMTFQGAGSEQGAQGQVINGMSLQVGDAFAPHIGGVVLDNNPLSNLRVGGIRIHGVLGASLFNSFAVEIDYRSRILRLHQDQQFADDASFSVHDIQISRHRPILKSEMQCNNRQYEVDLMIDTGFNNELLIYDHTMFDYTQLPTEKIGKGYCGSVKAASARIESLTIVAQQIADVKAILPATHSYRAADNEITDRDGTIGNGLLKRFCIVFDYAEQTLYLKKQVIDDDPYLNTFLADERR